MRELRFRGGAVDTSAMPATQARPGVTDDRIDELRRAAAVLDQLIDRDRDHGRWREYTRASRRLLAQAISAEARRCRTA